MFNVEHQREIARVALKALEPYGFALAGSGSIREHGLTDRPTEDIDLFTVMKYESSFSDAVTAATNAISELDLQASVIRQSKSFARIEMTTGDNRVLNIDMAVDWRQFPPTRLEIGNVLNMDDAVASKISALYSRAEPRDYLDVDAIRLSGKYSDDALLSIAANFDPGFDIAMFAQRLRGVSYVFYESVEVYGVNESEFEQIQKRLTVWAEHLSQPVRRSAQDLKSELSGRIKYRIDNNSATSRPPQQYRKGRLDR